MRARAWPLAGRLTLGGLAGVLERAGLVVANEPGRGTWRRLSGPPQ
jgi:hypothetical protein